MSDIDLVVMRACVKKGIEVGIADTKFLAELDAELKARCVKGA
jgi:hypothetical protein